MWNIQSILFYLLTLFLLLVNCDYRDFGNQNFSENLIEGDMILNEEQNRWFTKEKSPHRRIKRNSRTDAKYLWPNGIVYYKIDDTFEQKFKDHIEKAIDFLTENTCLKFEPPRNGSKAFLRFKSSKKECSSELGFQNRIQFIALIPKEIDEQCFRLGSIMHEIMHAIGFAHQHSAQDRDNYVTIKYENIQEGKKFNFRKMCKGCTTDFGLGYDYWSIMHYPAVAYSKNGEPTIVPKDPTAKMGNREALSEMDILKIKALYKCP